MDHSAIRLGNLWRAGGDGSGKLVEGLDRGGDDEGIGERWIGVGGVRGMREWGESGLWGRAIPAVWFGGVGLKIVQLREGELWHHGGFAGLIGEGRESGSTAIS